jgi:radical SAM superfamily enzyme YgiQ (UPF0313 family)
VRADYLNEDILRKCAHSGCTYLRIGVESANRHVSKNIIKKQLQIEKVIEISRLCNLIGIDIEAFYIIGFPGEKISQMKETIDFAVTQERLSGLYPYDMFTATPLIGTDLYNICVENKYFSKQISTCDMATATQGEGMITTGDFTPRDLKKLLLNYRIRHAIARVVYSTKFLFRHPRYFVIRFGSNFHVRHFVKMLVTCNVLVFGIDLFLFRYKNCIMRKVGMR